MQEIDRTVWVSFDIDDNMAMVTGMTYSVGKLRVRNWVVGDAWPKALDIAVGNGYTFTGTENDRIIWECVMQVDHGWPKIFDWRMIHETTETN